MAYNLKKYLLIFTVLILQSCAGIPPPAITSKTFPEKGVVIFEVMEAFQNNARPYPVSTYKLNKTRYLGNNKSFLAIPLKPGKHSLTDVEYANSNVTLTHPINKNFVIEAGKITNLGMILLMPKDKNSSFYSEDKYSVLLLDNKQRMERWADINSPLLAKKILDNQLLQDVDQKYANNILTLIQVMIATGSKNVLMKDLWLEEWQSGARDTPYPADSYINTGYLGTAISDPGRSVLKGLKLPLLNRITHCDSLGYKLACISQDAVTNKMVIGIQEPLHFSAKEKARSLSDFTLYPLPTKQAITHFRVINDGNFIMIDEAMNMWKGNINSPKFEQCLPGYDKPFKSFWGGNINVLRRLNENQYLHYYKNTRGTHLNKIDISDLSCKSVDIPKYILALKNILVNKNSALWGPNKKGEYYTWDYHQDTWQHHALPQQKCKKFEALWEVGAYQVECNKQVYRSNDFGKTWQ